MASVNTQLIHDLLDKGYIPVIAPIGVGRNYESYNINADSVAGEVAGALAAEKLLLTDVEGIYRDFNDKSSFISTLTFEEAQALIVDKVIDGGMILSVEACVRALKGGAKKAHIIDGRQQHSLLLEVFTWRYWQRSGALRRKEHEQECSDGAGCAVLSAGVRQIPPSFWNAAKARMYTTTKVKNISTFGRYCCQPSGHGHPGLVKAVAEQAGKLIHCSNLYYTEVQAKLVQKLTQRSGLERVFIANSGAEANEGAMKLARKYGKRKARARWKSSPLSNRFHGRTLATLTQRRRKNTKKAMSHCRRAFPMCLSAIWRRWKRLFRLRPARYCWSLFKAKAACTPLCEGN